MNPILKEDNIGVNLKLFNKSEACGRVMFVSNTCLYCVVTLACVSTIGLKLAGREEWQGTGGNCVMRIFVMLTAITCN